MHLFPEICQILTVLTVLGGGVSLQPVLARGLTVPQKGSRTMRGGSWVGEAKESGTCTGSLVNPLTRTSFLAFPTRHLFLVQEVSLQKPAMCPSHSSLSRGYRLSAFWAGTSWALVSESRIFSGACRQGMCVLLLGYGRAQGSSAQLLTGNGIDFYQRVVLSLWLCGACVWPGLGPGSWGWLRGGLRAQL